MSLDPQTIAALAARLETAERDAREIPKITDDHPDLGWEDAYAIQDAIRARKEARGHRVVGFKAGLTSFAKMKQMGVSTPVFGFLTEAMRRPDDGAIETAALIHPKAEAEIGIVTKTALAGPGCDVAAVRAATDFVIPGLEIIDSRYRDFRFDVASVIADNTSAARYVLGTQRAPLDALDLPTLGVVLEKNGEIVATATGAAVLGQPLAAVALLANHLALRGHPLPAGSLVLTGGMTEAIAVGPGDRLCARFHDLGTVAMRFV